MKITVQRTGGFAGMTESMGTIDTRQLDASRARDVTRAVEEVGFFALPEQVRGPEIGADLFSYEVTILDNGRSRTVRFQDQDEPTMLPLRRLVDIVTQAR
jgi:hypothetical protein